jgi:hypothetical protein
MRMSGTHPFTQHRVLLVHRQQRIDVRARPRPGHLRLYPREWKPGAPERKHRELVPQRLEPIGARTCVHALQVKPNETNARKSTTFLTRAWPWSIRVEAQDRVRERRGEVQRREEVLVPLHEGEGEGELQT